MSIILMVHINKWYLVPEKDDSFELDIAYMFLCFTIWKKRRSNSIVKRM